MNTFVSRYPEHPVRLSVVRGEKEVLEKVVFRNAVFQTEDNDLANALRTHPHFGLDWGEKKEKVTDVNKFRHAEDKELYHRLNSLSHSQLKNIAFEKKVGSYKPKDGSKSLMAMKKEELVDLLMDKRHNIGEYFEE